MAAVDAYLDQLLIMDLNGSFHAFNLTLSSCAWGRHIFSLRSAILSSSRLLHFRNSRLGGVISRPPCPPANAHPLPSRHVLAIVPGDVLLSFLEQGHILLCLADGDPR